jgi:thiamine biosynthesis lipoprotein
MFDMNGKRRKLLRIIGATAGATMFPYTASGQQGYELFSWEGYALGTDTEIQLYAADKSHADDVVVLVNKLIAKLENIFSLYDPTSEIIQLNKTGELENASPEMIDLLRISKSFWENTNGAFDITVQPLWELYDRFRNDGDQVAFDRDLENVIAMIGSDKIIIDGNRASFTRDGMAISFNGIAQGYITDKACALLKENGFIHTLIDVGEYRSGGLQWGGDPWRIGLLDPFDQVSIADIVELDTGGLATSGGYGFVFADDGSKHHLFNPVTGLSANQYASVTVIAKDATTADALSTAFSNMSEDTIEAFVKDYGKLDVRLTHYDGTVSHVVS